MLLSMLRVRVGSPLGDLWAFVHGDALVALDLDESRTSETLAALARRLGAGPCEDGGGATLDLARRFEAYFERRDPRAFEGLALDPGGTPFQQAVWKALCGIPPGATRTYAEIAREIGSPGAVRAVGAANGANPIPIVIPCHRVVRTGGALGGYGGGLQRKAWLLAHERAALLPGRLLDGPGFTPVAKPVR
jgi:methylated-DNA-[protein]-cysteine S-methyltransferase